MHLLCMCMWEPFTFKRNSFVPQMITQVRTNERTYDWMVQPKNAIYFSFANSPKNGMLNYDHHDRLSQFTPSFCCIHIFTIAISAYLMFPHGQIVTIIKFLAHYPLITHQSLYYLRSCEMVFGKF